LFWGLKRPNIPVSGTDFAGVVDVLGRGVSGYVIGDRVWGFHDDGASSHAEHITFPTSEAISLIPEGLTFAQAAACAEGAHYAFYFMDGLGIGHGHKVLVNGATGAIGSALVQMLKASGADVTAVCATPHILMVKDLGAKRVIDYLKEDFTRDTEK
jgi:NADPH:quinone reductase-like Zn-dependent oxidoreductase